MNQKLQINTNRKKTLSTEKKYIYDNINYKREIKTNRKGKGRQD